MTSSEISAYNVLPSALDKKIEVPTSKSFANRALILGAISLETVSLKNIPQSTDVTYLLEALKRVGVDCIEKGDETIIAGSYPKCEKSSGDVIELSSGDGGTTNRFLMALLSRGKNRYLLKASPLLIKRPQEELIDRLNALGAAVSVTQEGFQIQGPISLSSNEIEITAKRSTQFASALALALADMDVNITATNIATSNIYFQMTQKMIAEFKSGKCDFVTPGDWSSASYPLALGLHSGECVISNLHRPDPFQADCAILDIAKRMGGDTEFCDEGLRTKKSPLKGIEIDCRDHIDLVPTLSFLCAYAKGESKLSSISGLRHKESDRLAEIMRLLSLFNVKHSYDEAKDFLTIFGRSPDDREVEYNAPLDHRMIMTAYLFMRHNGGGKIYNSCHVNKSFSNFCSIKNRDRLNSFW